MGTDFEGRPWRSPRQKKQEDGLHFVTFLLHSFVTNPTLYEGHLESKERFAIQRYLLTIGKKQNMQVLSHTFTYFST